MTSDGPRWTPPGTPCARAGNVAVGSEYVLRSALQYDALDLIKQIPPRNIDLRRPSLAEYLPQRRRDDAEERHEQFARRAVGVVRRHLAFDQAEMATPFAGEIEERLDRQGEHRPLHRPAAFAAKHLLGFGMFAKQFSIDR